jgi:hypothetical protein
MATGDVFIKLCAMSSLVLGASYYDTMFVNCTTDVWLGCPWGQRMMFS